MPTVLPEGLEIRDERGRLRAFWHGHEIASMDRGMLDREPNMREKFEAIAIAIAGAWATAGKSVGERR
jgi:hypothetical protein